MVWLLTRPARAREMVPHRLLLSAASSLSLSPAHLVSIQVCVRNIDYVVAEIVHRCNLYSSAKIGSQHSSAAAGAFNAILLLFFGDLVAFNSELARFHRLHWQFSSGD